MKKKNEIDTEFVTINEYSDKKVLKSLIALLNTDGGALIINSPDKYNLTDNSILELMKKSLPKGHIIESSADGSYFRLYNNSLIKVFNFPRLLFITVIVADRDDKLGYVYLQHESPSNDREYYMRVKGQNRKVALETIIQSNQKSTPNQSPSKMSQIISFPDTKYISDYVFKNGYSVPVFEALSAYGFNRIVGYLKYINRKYGNVYSRGECKLHDSLIPSLYRNAVNIKAEDKKIKVIVNRFLKDNKLLNDLSLDVRDAKRTRYRVEGVLQHYGATTSFLDVVDNHWVALWMGLNRYNIKIQTDKYAEYVERSIPSIDNISNEMNARIKAWEVIKKTWKEEKSIMEEQKKTWEEERKTWEGQIYQYVILIAAPFSDNPTIDGIKETKDIIEVDLRKALPSTFLRPHAQHGLVIKRKRPVTQNSTSDDYDLSQNVVGIIKIRIDRAKEWIGNGKLLTQDSLIPPAGYDPGYDLLLSKYKIFNNSTLKITKFM
ncbi:MAG: FRG domain-containing protein [Muribaculaceae bacterium]|nr:FRG domain-containing protein [Muribaculaceae bacterium]